MKKAKKGNDKKAISRAKSYAERPSNYGSIQEEDKVNEELGEALHLSQHFAYSKNEQQVLTPNNREYTLIYDYIKPANQRKSVKANAKSAFEAKFINWQKTQDNSNDEQYIEYQIQIEYFELEGIKWSIFRRYSDFVELN